jgi:TPR repeat protein
MFGRLGDPQGSNNPLSQVLYGLALRHGWGIAKDEARAVTYLSAAASNSANIEELALQAGMKKGGLAKGELTLALFELANCFRNGWGVKRDPVAAKQYYETAANMGDTDAMNEVAWCYLEGFGCKKDKVSSSLIMLRRLTSPSTSVAARVTHQINISTTDVRSVCHAGPVACA